MTKSTLLLLPFLFCFCENPKGNAPPVISPKKETEKQAVEKAQWQPSSEGTTIAGRFPPPDGFERVPAPPKSFAYYLRHLPLKPTGSEVFLFDGSKKGRQDVHVAVVDMDVGKRDLQQCADAVMRLRAEHLFAQKKYGEIHFNFVNGFHADYSTWREGHRIKVNGNQVSWQPSQRESTGYTSFRKYLDMVFSYAGTLSLAKEMKPVELAEMQIGDVFIQGGSPGHAVIVVDMAAHPGSGKKCFLLAQSYMPAQDIHVLKNPEGGVWYDMNLEGELETPEWTFSGKDLKRFD